MKQNELLFYCGHNVYELLSYFFILVGGLSLLMELFVALILCTGFV